MPASVALAGRPIGSSDPETVRQFAKNELVLDADNVWYEEPDEDGVRKLFVYPTPGEALELLLEYVFRPVPFTSMDDVPSEFPEEFHRKLLHSCAAVYYGSIEDNPELETLYDNKADTAAGELFRYGNMRRGNGTFVVPIMGLTG